MINGRAPFQIVFVCTGNICRSPAAENIFREYARRAGILPRVKIDSAGTGDWHEGASPDPRTVTALRDAGYEAVGTARSLRDRDFLECDLFVCMDRSHVMAVLSRGALPNRVLLVREFDARRSHEDVPDPYYGGQSGFVEMVDMLEAAMDGLVLHVGSALEGRNHRAI